MVRLPLRDPGATFYVIEEGDVRVSKVDAAGVSHELPSLHKGQYFGGTRRGPPSCARRRCDG